MSTGQGAPAVIVERLESRVFENARMLRIWLPPGYHDAGNASVTYPVIYMNDGQNLFDAAAAFNAMEWGVDEAAARLIGEGQIPPIVVVGIDNAGRARAREYLPYPDTFLSPPEPDPQGRRYGEFLALEVLPFVESRFRVGRSRVNRALGGSSYGALVAAHVAITRPELFSGLLLESPSFYVDDEHLLRDAARGRLALDRVYLGVGTNELGLANCPVHPDNAEAVDGVTKMAALLRTQGITEDDHRLLVVIEPCAVHNEAAWSRRLPTALRFLFPAPGIGSRQLRPGPSDP
jgi:predicted alpha/beta superfamily hydrolase